MIFAILQSIEQTHMLPIHLPTTKPFFSHRELDFASVESKEIGVMSDL